MKKRGDESIGQRIREKRVALGWTQGNLAKASGLSRIYIIKIEKAQIKSPGVKALEQIRVSLGMSWEDLCK